MLYGRHRATTNFSCGQAQQKQLGAGKSLKWVAIIMATLCALVGTFAITSLNNVNANALEAESTTQYNLSVKTDGYTTGVTTPTLDRKVYTDGDSVNLTLSGNATGDDFVMPTKVTYGNQVFTVSQLYDVASMQTVNSEYLRRMNETQTITDYDTLKSAVTTAKTIKVGTASALNNEITVTYERITPVYRMYNMMTSEHLFTTNKKEYDDFVYLGTTDDEYWLGEGISWLAPASAGSTSQVYRLYNAALGAMGRSSHYYTADMDEKANLEANLGWVDDGTQNGFLSGGDTAIWTAYSEALGSAHHYTSNKAEWSGLDGGWDKEVSKNGDKGVFSGVLATGWSFDGNFYVVKHNLQDTTGQKYETHVTTFVSGKSGDNTAATANTYPGFSAPETIEQQAIKADNSTVVEINYTRNTTSIVFSTDGGSEISPRSALYGSTLSALTDTEVTTKSGYTFVNWYYDQACTDANVVTFGTDTVPASDVTLYAKWEQKTTDKTDASGKVNLFDNTSGKVVEAEVKDASGNPITNATISVDESGTFVVVTPPAFDESSVVVTIKDDKKEGVSDRDVILKDSTEAESDKEKTDDQGQVTFGNKQTTDSNGQATVVKPGSTDKYVTTITDKDGNVVEGAEVIVDENGKVTIKLPENYNSDEVKVTIKDDKDQPREGVDVTVKDHQGNDKGTTTTDKDGVALIKQYTVTFQSAQAAVEAQKVNVGRFATRPADPSADGYTFDNWYAEEAYTTAFDFEKVAITKDTTVYAKWTEKTTDKADESGKVNVYDKTDKKVVEATITDLNGNPIPGATLTINDDGTYTVKTPEGYDSTSVVVTLKDKEGAALSGKTVTLQDSKGTETGKGTTDSEGKVIFAKSGTTGEDGKTTVVKPGSTDKYVTTITDKDNKPVPGAEVAIDNDGKVTVKLPEGFSSDEVKVTIKDDKDAARTDVEVTVTDNNGGDKGTTKTDSQGVATIKQYTVTFSLDHATVTAQKVNVGRTATKPETPTADGYTFDDWYTESEYTTKFEFSTAITADKTLYGKWTSKPTDTTDSNGKTTVVKPNSSDKYVTTVTDGSGNAIVGAEVTISSEGKVTVKLPASCTAEEIKVTVKDGDDKARQNVEVSVTENGGTEKGNTKTNESGVADIKQYTVKFECEGSTTTVAEQKVYVGKHATKPETTPSKDNFEFKKWVKTKDGDEEFKFDTEVITGDTTVYAKFEEKKEQITISFNCNAGSDSITSKEAVTIDKGGCLTDEQLKTPGERTKYDFDGWYLQGEGVTTTKVTTSTTLDSATTLMAVWTIKSGVDCKTIKLELCDTDQKKGATCTVSEIKVPTGEKASKPADPCSSTGYLFINWYTSNERQQEDTVYNWNNTVTEDKTIYAAWSAEYTITYHANANDKITVSGEMASETVKVGVGKKLTANKFTATAKGDTTKVYGFKGWSTKDGATTMEYCDRYDGAFSEATPNSTIDLYAVWTADELGSYWLGQAKKSIRGLESQANGDYYNTPESGVIKTQSEIEADLQKIKSSGVESQTYQELATLYRGYMNKDNVHLYTMYGGATCPSTNANDYAEFRIINVGAHIANDNTSDNSILTFQMTHALPSSYQFSSNSTDAGGYASSTIHTTLTSGEIWGKFSEAFKSKVMTVTKYTRMGWKKQTVDGNTKGVVCDDICTTTDKFWLPALTELASTVKTDFEGHKYQKEGKQYQFYADKGVSGENTINALKDLQKNRAEGNMSDTLYSTSWLTRSANSSTETSMYAAMSICDGKLCGADISPNMKTPVVPCFCVTAS